MSTALPVSAAPAAQTCDFCPAYATADVNLRKAPDSLSAVVAVVPAGTQVSRSVWDDADGFALVDYNGLPGWIAVDYLVWEWDGGTAGVGGAPAESTRVTLAPINLRSGPGFGADVLFVLPEGSVVTLTYEGAEDNFVTVDYDGTQGWVYADLIG